VARKQTTQQRKQLDG